MLVRSRMTPNVITAPPQTTLSDAFRLTRGERIRHLPVCENERLVGVVTDRDLRSAMPPIWMAEHEVDELRASLERKTIGDVMITNVITTTANTPIEDAARLLYEHRIGCLPVMEGDRMIGILTETDVLRAFVELFGVEQRSVRIEVLMQNRPGELARVVKAVGVDFKLNITGMVVPPIQNTNEALAILHVQTNDSAPIVEHLRKLGYKVGAPSLDLEPAEAHTSTPQRIRHWATENF